MSAVARFKTRRERDFGPMLDQLNDVETDCAVLVARTRDGAWHCHYACTGDVRSMEMVGIIEMVKLDVVADYNLQQDP